MKLTDEQLALLDAEDREAWERAQNATEGPWTSGAAGHYEVIAYYTDKSWNNDVLCGDNRRNDGLFIAAARTDIPRLIQKLAHALEQIAAAKLMAEVMDKIVNREPPDGRGREFVLVPIEFEDEGEQALAAWKAVEPKQDCDDDGD